MYDVPFSNPIFHGRHYELIDGYGIRVTQMLSDLSPNKSNTMMSLVEQELLVFPTFTSAVSNVIFLVFCSIFGCSLFVFVVLLAIAFSILIQFTASDFSFHIFKRFPTVIMAILQLKTFET